MKYLLSFGILILMIIIGLYLVEQREAPAYIDDVTEHVQNMPSIPETEEDDDMETQTDPKSDITFTYPSKFPTTYITAQEWPPRFVHNGGSFNCEIDAQTAAMSGFKGRTETINGNTYCIWERSEGAAGSVYHDFQISYDSKDGYTYVMSFTLKVVQCANYPEPESTTCKEEVDTFDLLSLIDPIAQSAFTRSQ